MRRRLAAFLLVATTLLAGARRMSRGEHVTDVRAPAAMREAPPPDDVTSLGAALATGDAARTIALVEAAAQEGTTGTLPLLASIDLEQEPEAAPAIIAAVATLGRRSPETAALGGRTLARWLAEEMARDGRDAVGNVANLVEALGALGGPEAVSALVLALDDPRTDLAGQTVIVQQLTRLGDESARSAILRFAERARDTNAADDFERQLQHEALASADPWRHR